jgi:hypothetical protein
MPSPGLNLQKEVSSYRTSHLVSQQDRRAAVQAVAIAFSSLTFQQWLSFKEPLFASVSFAFKLSPQIIQLHCEL